MTIHRYFPKYSDFELSQYGHKFRWSPTNLVKTHVGIDFKERRVSVMGEWEDLLAIDPTLTPEERKVIE